MVRIGDAGANADGEYAWIYEDESRRQSSDSSGRFSTVSCPTLGTAGGVAYPGFNDYYQEGGVGNVVPFEIPHDNGQTLDAVLDQFQTYVDIDPNRIDFLQWPRSTTSAKARCSSRPSKPASNT